MTEYIEREKVLAKIDEAFFETDPDGKEQIGVLKCRAIIRKTPAADVAPVVHGRWLTWEEMFPGKTPKKKNNLGVFCGSCKNHADNMSDYCHNCGARMDGDVERRNT